MIVSLSIATARDARFKNFFFIRYAFSGLIDDLMDSAVKKTGMLIRQSVLFPILSLLISMFRTKDRIQFSVELRIPNVDSKKEAQPELLT